MYLIAPTRVLLEYVWFQRRMIIKLQLFDAQNIKIDICKTALFIDITSRCNSSCSFYVSGYFFPINLPCNILWIVGICGHTQPKCINRFEDRSPIILQVTFHPRVVYVKKKLKILRLFIVHSWGGCWGWCSSRWLSLPSPARKAQCQSSTLH